MAIHKEIDDLREPLDIKLLNLGEENKLLHRTNQKFLGLYRECLGELQSEIREKKQVLDTS